MFYDGISKWSYTMSTFVQNSGFMVFYEGTRKSAYRKSKFGNEQKFKYVYMDMLILVLATTLKSPNKK